MADGCRSADGSQVLGVKPRRAPSSPNPLDGDRDAPDCRERHTRPHDLSSTFSIRSINYNHDVPSLSFI
jgi:hypothetical protein